MTASQNLLPPGNWGEPQYGPSKYLNRLVELQILVLETEGKESLYRNVPLYEILARG